MLVLIKRWRGIRTLHSDCSPSPRDVSRRDSTLTDPRRGGASSASAGGTGRSSRSTNGGAPDDGGWLLSRATPGTGQSQRDGSAAASSHATRITGCRTDPRKVCQVALEDTDQFASKSDRFAARLNGHG